MNKIVKGLIDLIKDQGIQNIHIGEYDKYTGFNLRFTNPIRPVNKENWVDFTYNPELKRLTLITHGFSDEIPKPLVESISSYLPNSSYSHIHDCYEWAEHE
ncbi:MAG: hypothetical protein WC867_03010 [Candidatus Pacearchaeota archaeon]|jgi:hypothetical protein